MEAINFSIIEGIRAAVVDARDNINLSPSGVSAAGDGVRDAIKFDGHGVWTASTMPGNGSAAMSGKLIAAPVISGATALILSDSNTKSTFACNLGALNACTRLSPQRGKIF